MRRHKITIDCSKRVIISAPGGKQLVTRSSIYPFMRRNAQRLSIIHDATESFEGPVSAD